MSQCFVFFIGILLIVHPLIEAQDELDWCADSPPSSEIDPNWSTIPIQFEILAELVGDNKATEITQAFTPTRDSIYKKSGTDPALLYWYYETYEHFRVTNIFDGTGKKPDCTRQDITPEIPTSLIDDGLLYLKPSILLGFDSRNRRNPSWGVRYESNGVLRNMPTKIFKSCFNISDINATAKVTYHVSDVTKFQAYLPANESLILQIDVNITNNEYHQVYTYNVFRFTPNPYELWERLELETPSGVYCPNRTTGRLVPVNIMDRMILNAESFVPPFGDSIYSSHNLYDQEYQYARFDVWFPDPFGRSSWYYGTEIHDYGVGLVYQFDHMNRQCKVQDISSSTFDAASVDGNPNAYEMGSAQHLFLMDDINYQYTGEKLCRDRVWCDVWIGENVYANGTVDHREWYLAKRINDVQIRSWIPIKLIVKRYVSRTLDYNFEMNVFNYRPDPRGIYQIDYTLADCFRALGPTNKYNLGVLSFKIGNERNYPVFENLNYLRYNIWETLLHTLNIRPIRLSHLVVDQSGTDILVTFTLLDVPPRVGPVEIPLVEASLEKLIETLTTIIDQNALIFRPKSGTKVVTLRARTESLNIVHQSSSKNERSIGPLITGLWIGCVVAGLLVGGVASFCIFEKLAKRSR